MKMLAADAFSGILQIVWPLFFATTAFLMFRISGDHELVFYAGLGATVMGIWSSVAASSSSALQRERWLGTLELIVSAPMPFALVLSSITTAMATIGLYSMVATLIWGWLVFGMSLHIVQPIAFGCAVVVLVFAIAMIGFLLSVTVVRYRSAWAIGSLLECPVWLLCGLLVPVALLPVWVRPLSYVLPPTWGVRAMREAASGTSPWVSLLVCAVLGGAYALMAALIGRSLLKSARRQATLALT
ncbi:ABC-2 type transport system permease protein [Actinoplanes couchii]|nr:ABC-2 type transport system permease protein [Actinoplanes couchii]